MDKMIGMVFDIQRYSLHDGKGIRTIVFLKGCPLACKWCANPESQQPNAELFYITSKCILCGECVNACPHGALSMKNGKIVIEREKCVRCFSCTRVCPTMALMQKGREMTIGQVVREAMRDRVFFEKSGGGVTLSGGEPFYQFKFALALLKELKKHNINTVVETTGYVSAENLKQALPYVDMFYYDVKHVDMAKHKLFVGVENELILNNLQSIMQAGANVSVRIPVIPGVNADPPSIRQIAEILKQIGVEAIELLKFHQYGANKYAALDNPYEFRGVEIQSNEEFENVKQQYRDAGINVY